MPQHGYNRPLYLSFWWDDCTQRALQTHASQHCRACMQNMTQPINVALLGWGFHMLAWCRCLLKCAQRACSIPLVC